MKVKVVDDLDNANGRRTVIVNMNMCAQSGAFTFSQLFTIKSGFGRKLASEGNL